MYKDQRTNTITTVSYTHLYEFRGIPMMAPDILTVQTATSVMGNYTFKLTFEQYSVILVWMASVSYTHLDVYKRQMKHIFHMNVKIHLKKYLI